MARQIFDLNEDGRDSVVEFLAIEFSSLPVGWHMEIGAKALQFDKLVIETSAPMTQGTYNHWGPGWVVTSITNEINNACCYPEDFGDTPEEAFRVYCEELAEEAVSELFHMLSEREVLS